MTNNIAIQQEPDADQHATQPAVESRVDLGATHTEEPDIMEKRKVLEDWNSLITKIITPEEGPFIIEQVNGSIEQSVRLENYYKCLHESVTVLEATITDTM